MAIAWALTVPSAAFWPLTVTVAFWVRSAAVPWVVLVIRALPTLILTSLPVCRSCTVMIPLAAETIGPAAAGVPKTPALAPVPGDVAVPALAPAPAVGVAEAAADVDEWASPYLAPT